MPEISRFLGIHVRVHYRDPGTPHVHAQYGDYEVTLEIDSGVVSGQFPRRALAALLEWHSLHRDELERAAQQSARQYQVDRIEPLE
ncbi:MAG: DUF4160 domain-containing protein [Thermoguttaceae bacterium]